MILNIKHDVYEMYYLGIRTMDDRIAILSFLHVDKSIKLVFHVSVISKYICFHKSPKFRIFL